MKFLLLSAGLLIFGVELSVNAFVPRPLSLGPPPLFAVTTRPSTDGVDEDKVMEQMQEEAERLSQELIDETCEVDPETAGPVDELCLDDEKRDSFRAGNKRVLADLFKMVRSKDITNEKETMDLSGEVLEEGWEQRANSNSLRRNAEIYKFALATVFRVLKPRKLRKSGASDEEIKAAKQEAAEFLRDGLLKLGPSFVKFGQVLSTRTDVLSKTYTDVLQTLTDQVPGFSGEKAKEIISKELGRPCDEVFTDFDPVPVKAASLGQVHTAMYKGQKVAIKVQRSALKELFDVDLGNLRKLAVLLDKFDPKSDGADRDWVKIYEESARLLYLEIDYLHEASNTERFAKDFEGYDWVRIPDVIREVTTPRVLVMEFVESFKLTDIAQVEQKGLDRQLLGRRVADAFLRQIIETSYFHGDPHSGNLCVDKEGNLVYYDFGLMDELKPNVREGFRTFCKALFAGGPKISDADLAKNAKELVRGVEQAGVVSQDADRLAVEKFARYFMRAFKNKQLGISNGNIKETIGADLQTLTENNVFRFPSTFTFIFRAFASVEGIGKELDPDFDIGQLAQPFIDKFTDSTTYKSEADKNWQIFRKATGLNSQDIETAVRQPRKVEYIEQTLRDMEYGKLKIRTRSLENEKALERLDLRQNVLENLVVSGLLLNGASLASRAIVRNLGLVGAGIFLFQGIMAQSKIKKFDKTQGKFQSKSSFVEDAVTSEE